MRDRRTKTNVALLEFNSGVTPNVTRYTNSTDLREALGRLCNDGSSGTFQLFVAEDLSLEVIDCLGGQLKIPPDVFRAHILDFSWHNIQSGYREQPFLDVASRGQNWFCMRFPRARCYDSAESRKHAFKESETFNVHREPRHDGNMNMVWDKFDDARVTLTRSKATFWIRSAAGNQPTIGEPSPFPRGLLHAVDWLLAVLLLDPTVSGGHRLWRYYPNWGNQNEFPDTGNPSGAGSLEDTFFEEFIRRVRKPQYFNPRSESSDGGSGLHTASSALVQIIMAEWLTIADLLKTRLFQTEWELAYPKRFHPGSFEDVMSRLSALRRFIPSYHEMISETLLRIFRVVPSDGTGFYSSTETEPAAAVRPPSHFSPAPEGVPLAHTMLGISDYQLDFQLLANRLTGYQQHTDRLVQAATATISIQDTRRSMKQNKNLQLLTYTVTPFIPMSFVAAIFSMQPNVTELHDTMILLAKTAVPSAILVISIIVWLDRAEKFTAIWRGRRRTGTFSC